MAVLFCVSYLSEVVGVRLADGREVVVKRRVDESGRAGRCVTAQRLLAEQGFPCPMPLTDVIVSDGVAVHAERFLGGKRERLSYSGFARLERPARRTDRAHPPPTPGRSAR